MAENRGSNRNEGGVILSIWRPAFGWLVLSFLLMGFSVRSQTISGRVIDSKTLEPLPFANVFLNNSTVGTTTQMSGDFVLKNVRQPAVYEVIFSFVGYETYKMKVSLVQDQLHIGTIRLKTSELELGSVEVKSTKDTQWEKRLKRFKKVFLGEDALAELCTLRNPWVIEFSEEGAGFTATASAPLEIENKALGYNLYFYLKNFQSTSTTYLIAGNVRFVEMADSTGAEAIRWASNRAQSYRHSRQHLFKAMLDHKIKGEGFNLYTEINELVNTSTRSAFFYSELGSTLKLYDTTNIVTATSQAGIYRINLKGRVEVHYRREKVQVRVYRDVFNPVSWITLNKGFVLVNRDGVELNPAEVVVAGDMNNDRVAHLLPINYVPEETYLEEQKQELVPLLEERIYVHTDKPYYYPGEPIWFKGYVSYREPVLADSLSRTVYVELVNRKKKEVLQSRVYRLDSGYFQGDFQSTEGISPGSYYLRAYTNLNRNFGDDRLFVKPIPFLAMTDKVKQPMDGKPWKDSLLTISVGKKPYKTREKITLVLTIYDPGDSLQSSNLSVSVTDANQVVPVEVADNILKSLPLGNEFLHVGKHGLIFPIEYGVNFSGRFYNDRKQPQLAMVNIFQISPQNFSVAQADEKGFFSTSSFLFYDTAVFSVQSMNEQGQPYGRAEWIRRNAPPVEFNEIPYAMDLEKTTTTPRVFTTASQDARMLEEIEIKASKLQEEDAPEFRIKRTYGKANYVLKARDINTSYGNLLLAIQGKFPGLVVRLVDNPGSGGTNGEGPKWMVYTLKSASGSMLNPKEVLVMVNDSFVGGSPGEILGTINPADVESVELKSGVNVLYGASSFGGVLSVYTKHGISDEGPKTKKSISTIKAPGYAHPAKFRSPDYGNPGTNANVPDYRSLLYWNPTVYTNAKTGSATLSFFASDLPGRYRVVVEGITASGKPVRSVKFIEIRER